ncbi:MAG: hypothetical protein WA940_00430 [Sphingopyxis sp.]
MNPTQKHVEIGDAALTLHFNFGMMRVAEKEIGSPIFSAFKAMQSGEVSLDIISVLWWAALNRKHKMTREAADNLVDDAGMDQVATWVMEGLTEYMGGAKAEGKQEPVGNAPKSKAKKSTTSRS